MKKDGGIRFNFYYKATLFWTLQRSRINYPPKLNIMSPLVRALLLLLLTVASDAYLSELDCSPNTTQVVVIIGGGSSGTYAAIRLQQLGYTVTLIEKNNRLGGHVNTFVDTERRQAVETGVMMFQNTSSTLEYLSHLEIPLVDFSTAGGNPPSFANFHTDAKIVTSLPASLPWTNQTAVGLQLAQYLDVLGRYPYIENGFDLPQSIPDELLMPFGEFIVKYNLEAISLTAAQFAQGAGNILAQQTIYVLKYFSKGVVSALFPNGIPFVRPASNTNQDIYDRARDKLG